MTTETEGRPSPAPCAPGSVLSLTLTQTTPGVYETWWSVPPDLPAGVYDLVGCLAIAGTQKAVEPPAVLIVLSPPAPPAPPAPSPPPPPTEIPGPGLPPPAPPPGGAAAGAPGAIVPTLLGSSQAPNSLPGLASGQAMWVTPDDAFYLLLQSNIQGLEVTVTWRLWTPAGEMSLGALTVATVTGTRSADTFMIPLSYGWLISAVVIANPNENATGGELYAVLSLMRGARAQLNQLEVLAAGYVVNFCPLSWPGSGVRRSVDLFPTSQAIIGATPAAGAEWGVAVPLGAVWRVISIVFKLVTSAVAANRIPAVAVINGTNDVLQVSETIAQPAGTTVIYEFGIAYPSTGVQISNLVTAAFPGDVVINSQFSLESSTTALQSGDQYSLVKLLVEEWLDQ